MNWYTKFQYRFAQIQKISLQEAKDRGMFGPVYHGTNSEARAKIDEEGFKVFEGEARSENIQHGYENHPYGYNPSQPPPPVHHLGYGIYFTTTKAIAKDFAGGTARGMKAYFIDAPNLETINWGATNTMMRWWIANGYDPELAKKDRVSATKRLTQTLKSQHEAVWYKGKGLYKLLDGDQVCVYDPSNIYEIDNSMSNPGDIGSKVRRKSDGMIGQILSIENIENILSKYPMAASWVKPGAKKRFYVKWRRGGTDMNVQDVDVDYI